MFAYPIFESQEKFMGNGRSQNLFIIFTYKNLWTEKQVLLTSSTKESFAPILLSTSNCKTHYI